MISRKAKTIAGSREPVAGSRKAERALVSSGIPNFIDRFFARARDLAAAFACSPAAGYRLPVPVFAPARRRRR